MSHTTSSLRRFLAFLSMVALASALFAPPAAAGPDSDPLEEAAAAVQYAKDEVVRTRTANADARALRDEVQERLTKRTESLQLAAQHLADAERALTRSRNRVDEAKVRLENAQTPGERREAREHLRAMRERRSERRAEFLAAVSGYDDAQAKVDHTTAALAAAQSALTTTRAALEAARVVLAQAREYHAQLAAEATREVIAAVANIPNRISDANFAASLKTLTADQPDFLTLNEISGRSLEEMRAAAPGYAVYRGGAKLTEPGAAGQSMNNAVLWRTDRYELVAQGRIQVVNDDRGYLNGKKFLWDRYATWVTLRNIIDGRLTSVIATHMPTNPAKFPKQWGNMTLTRVQLYALGMDKLTALTNSLAQQGRVLLAGDMNSHPGQGYWTAAAKMAAAGYAFRKDQGVMYLFHTVEATVPSSRQVSISSDHPALITTLDFGLPA
jgi:endonuclease/exonuclease/phosphatase family metal-dependent hydrolase